MWVEWPSEQYLIDRFNSQHTINDLAADRERSGMINAAIIGRPELTASVGVTKDGQRFTDFGAGARMADGTQDGGDPFEFYIRSHHLDKSEVLRELGQALNKEASSELLRAARAGELPPAWVMDIITDKGRVVYNQNAKKYGHQTLEDHRVRRGGVVGFLRPDTEPEEEEEETVEEGEQETRSLSLRKQRPTRDTPTWEKDERGLPVYCSQCGCFATWYAAGCAPYCEEHWQGYKKPNNLADHGAP